jgi:hypothetical protein
MEIRPIGLFEVAVIELILELVFLWLVNRDLRTI